MAIREAFIGALDASQKRTDPFRHWLLEQVFPADACVSLENLAFAPPTASDNEGKRETYNDERHFFSPDNRAKIPMFGEIAEALQDPATVAAIERNCEIDLDGSFLRIEYCIDRPGFWLEPHADISVKLYTMQIYLTDAGDGASLGTDLYDRDKNWVTTIPSSRGRGYIFIPAADTIHGFRKRDFGKLRKSIIVNYVKDEWRARHELAFPDQPVAG